MGKVIIREDEATAERFLDEDEQEAAEAAEMAEWEAELRRAHDEFEAEHRRKYGHGRLVVIGAEFVKLSERIQSDITTAERDCLRVVKAMGTEDLAAAAVAFREAGSAVEGAARRLHRMRTKIQMEAADTEMKIGRLDVVSALSGALTAAIESVGRAHRSLILTAERQSERDDEAVSEMRRRRHEAFEETRSKMRGG